MARKRAQTVECPGCGKTLELVPVPGKPGRVRGMCACRGGRPRAMIECDAPSDEAAKATGVQIDEEEAKG